MVGTMRHDWPRSSSTVACTEHYRVLRREEVEDAKHTQPHTSNNPHSPVHTRTCIHPPASSFKIVVHNMHEHACIKMQAKVQVQVQYMYVPQLYIYIHVHVYQLQCTCISLQNAVYHNLLY